MSQAIEQQLTGLSADFSAFMTKYNAEVKEFGTARTETKSQMEAIQRRIDDLEQKQIQHTTKEDKRTVAQEIKESESVSRLLKDGKGKAYFTLKGNSLQEFLETKSTITSSTVGFPTAGVMPEERGAYVPEARKKLRMRDVLSSRPISVAQYSWPKPSITGTKASPVAEAAQKPINTYDPTMVTERVKTIATLFKTGRQVLEDWSELEGILRSLGSYKYNQEMDSQILSGSNVGENLNGLITQATAFDSALLSASAGYTYFDQLAAAAQQVAEADETEPTFFVLHPRNWWQMLRLKDEDKNYLLDGPTGGTGAKSIWEMTPVVTTNITSGTFLVGSGAPIASEFRNRMELEVAISTEDDVNFQYNLVTIRFEGRGLMAVYRPSSYITGTFANSPAQS